MARARNIETVTPGTASLATLERLYGGNILRIDRSCKATVDEAAQLVAVAAQGQTPIYGINTGCKPSAPTGQIELIG